jgi:hypothetical protein
MMSGMMPQVRKGLSAAWRRSGDVSGGYVYEVIGEFCKRHTPRASSTNYFV